jgi:6-phosphofructokinase 1
MGIARLVTLLTARRKRANDGSRGCETYVIREGWEGLVRGNSDEVKEDNVFVHAGTPSTATPIPERRRGGFVATYGEGELLKEGEGEQTLKGRYIVRVSQIVLSE